MSLSSLSGITAASPPPLKPTSALPTQPKRKAPKQAVRSAQMVQVSYSIPIEHRQWLNDKGTEIRANNASGRRPKRQYSDRRAGSVYAEHLVQVAIELLMDSGKGIDWDQVHDPASLRRQLGLI